MALSTLGIKIGYCVATTAGTAPTSGYTELVGIKSIPAIGGAPETYESTTLNETEFKTYVMGLMDTGGSIELKFNNTDAFQTAWAALKSASDTDAALSSPKGYWFCIIIPGLTKGFYFEGRPAALALSQIDVGNVLEASGYVTLTKVKGWDTAATLSV